MTRFKSGEGGYALGQVKKVGEMRKHWIYVEDTITDSSGTCQEKLDLKIHY